MKKWSIFSWITDDSSILWNTPIPRSRNVRNQLRIWFLVILWNNVHFFDYFDGGVYDLHEKIDNFTIFSLNFTICHFYREQKKTLKKKRVFFLFCRRWNKTWILERFWEMFIQVDGKMEKVIVFFLVNFAIFQMPCIIWMLDFFNFRRWCGILSVILDVNIVFFFEKKQKKIILYYYRRLR